MVTAFVGGTVILPGSLVENTSLICRDGKITAMAPAGSIELPAGCKTLDCAGKYISPGFIDIHVHGGRGADFMDGTPAAVETACQAHARHGTTSLFATTTTGSTEQIHATIKACQAYQEQATGLHLEGVHLYGPYFAENKVGCHSLAGRRDPLPEEFSDYFQSGLVRIATCAAELQGAAAFYRQAVDSGCLVTCGHSNASWHEMLAAFHNGMRHVDHFWCAMSSVPSLRERFQTPMQASMYEFVLMHQEMSTEVIADGCHLSPELLEFAYRMLGPQRLCLVTDCNRALDMPPGKYRFGNAQDGSWLDSDGHVGWAPGRKSLASSVMGMDHMVQTMFRNTTASLPEVICMASLTPAQRTGIDAHTGSLQIGKRADILVLDHDLLVQQVYAAGQPLV